jgi:hypothetical protein
MSIPLRFESFRREWKDTEAEPHHSSTLIPTVRHSDGAVTSEGHVLRTGSSVIHQALKRKLKSRAEEGSAREWAVES